MGLIHRYMHLSVSIDPRTKPESGEVLRNRDTVKRDEMVGLAEWRSVNVTAVLERLIISQLLGGSETCVGE